LQIDSFSHLGRRSSGQTFGVACRVSEQIRGKSFRPISLFGETIVLSHIAADSVGGILWGASSAPRRCANPPGVQIQCLRDQIRDPTLTHFSLEVRALLLEQFPAYSDGLNSGRVFQLVAVTVFLRNRIFSSIYPCMHQICYHLLITGIFMLFDCIPVLIHEIWLTFIFYISSRLLYFLA
jgi:hypothetical protein